MAKRNNPGLAMVRRAAIFDVDRTLLDGVASNIFTGLLWKQGLLPLRNKARIVTTVAGYRTGILKEERLVELAVTSYAGLKKSMLEITAKTCTENLLKPRLYQEALDAIDACKKRNEIVILASGSSDFIVGALADHVGADRFAATSAAVNGNVSTRKINRPLCYKEGKLTLIQEILKDLEIDLEKCRLYSDNLVDMPVFRKVAHRHVVNPDSTLKDVAKRHGWEILQWSTPVDPLFEVTGTSWPIKSRGKK